MKTTNPQNQDDQLDPIKAYDRLLCMQVYAFLARWRLPVTEKMYHDCLESTDLAFQLEDDCHLTTDGCVPNDLAQFQKKLEKILLPCPCVQADFSRRFKPRGWLRTLFDDIWSELTRSNDSRPLDPGTKKTLLTGAALTGAVIFWGSK